MGATHTESGWNRGNLYFRDARYSPTRSLWKSCPIDAILHDPAVGMIFRDDFHTYDTTFVWGLTEDGTATQVLLDSVDGVLEMANGAAADEEEQYVFSIAENYLLVPGNPVWFEALFTITEANVDDVNLIFGLSEDTAANLMQDAGAGPDANFDGCVIYKVDGGTVWSAMCSDGAAQTPVADIGPFLDAAPQRVGFIYDGAGTVTPYANGVAGTPIITNLPTGTAMHIVFGVKNGDTNIETLLMDAVMLASVRT